METNTNIVEFGSDSAMFYQDEDYSTQPVLQAEPKSLFSLKTYQNLKQTAQFTFGSAAAVAALFAIKKGKEAFLNWAFAIPAPAPDYTALNMAINAAPVVAESIVREFSPGIDSWNAAGDTTFFGCDSRVVIGTAIAATAITLAILNRAFCKK